MKAIFTCCLALFFSHLLAQTSRTPVMTLGTFHFNFPNLDLTQTSKEDQIDVLSPRYQKEIEELVRRIAVFKPTIIVIERPTSRQAYTDSTYRLYTGGKYTLKRTEEEQVAFRLAKQLKLEKLYCADEWGSFTERLDRIVFGKDSSEAKKFETYFEVNPDTALRFNPSPLFKSKGILADLRQRNDEANIRRSLGNYLIGPFKYESAERDFTGVDFETGRWFNRNLKIFRNIQRIAVSPSDRILVLFGSGHLNLLNYFFDCSPEYKLVRTNDYLK